jgi:ATP-dependent transcriptional regulator
MTSWASTSIRRTSPRSSTAPRDGPPVAAGGSVGPGRTGAGDAAGVAGFVDAFTGSHRFVLDYLVEEVLNSQPDDVRMFLLDTSVLQQLTGAVRRAHRPR